MYTQWINFGINAVLCTASRESHSKLKFKGFENVIICSWMSYTLHYDFWLFSFFIIVAMFQIIQSKTYKFEIFSMCIVAYIPILIGSLINLILSLIFGYYSEGYISVYQFFPSGILQDMMKQLAPFQILSVLFMSYLYINYYNKGKINMVIIFSTWLLLSMTSVLIL